MVASVEGNILSGGGRVRCQITVVNVKGAGKTYSLEGKRSSDHSCDYRGGRDDIQPGGQDIRSQL
jgi:hypothetical protein